MIFSLLNKRRASPQRMARELKAAGRLLPVTVVENDRATRLTLRIAPGGKALKVTIPPHVTDQQVEDFLVRNRNWVSARIGRLPETVVASNGALIPYRGTDHRIVSTGKLRGVVTVATHEGLPSLNVPGAPDAAARKLLAFFKEQARRSLDERVAIHAAALGVRPKSLRIADTASRWGSCSTTRTLSFSWRIIMAPPEVLDYLAAHEVAHLREMNHSPAFWALVSGLCPQMERHKSWLRQHGQKLHAVELG